MRNLASVRSGSELAAERLIMSRKAIHVVPTADGWAARRPNAQRSSGNASTQAEAMKIARRVLGNDGGGEMRIHGRNGQIRAADTIAPANDPRESKG